MKRNRSRRGAAAWRIILIAAVLGGILIWFGWQEYVLGKGATTEAQETDLAALEKGAALTNPHVKFGEHICIFNKSLVYSYEKDLENQKSATPASEVNHAYYPIVSTSHKFSKEYLAMMAKYGSIGKTPEKERPNLPNTFTVLVKTRAYKTVGDLPDGVAKHANVQGLVINEIEGLDSDERRLIRGRFPKLDLDKVLILERGREPSSPTMAIAFIGAGGAIIVLGIGLVVWLSRRGGKTIPRPGMAPAQPAAPANPYEQPQQPPAPPRA